MNLREQYKQLAISNVKSLLDEAIKVRTLSGSFGPPELLCSPSESTDFIRKYILPLYQDSGYDLTIEENFQYPSDYADSSVAGKTFTMIRCTNLKPD